MTDRLSDSPLTLRAFNPRSDEDCKNSAKLMNACWGDSDFSELSYVHWQYRENPFGDALGFVYENRSGEFASQYVAIPTPFLLGQQTSIGLLSVNTATDSKHRGKGLFIESAKATFSAAEIQNYSGVFGAPNDSSLPGFKKLGFQILPPLRLSVALPSFSTLLRGMPTLYRERKFPHFHEAPVDAERFRASVLSTGERRLSNFQDARPANHDSQFESRVSIDRNADWLRWRYENHPTRRYFLAECENVQLVFRSFSLGSLRIAVVMDVFGSSTKESTRAFSHFFKREKYSMVAGVHSSEFSRSLFHSALGMNGFLVPTVFTPKSFSTIWKTLCGKPQMTSHNIDLGAFDLY